MFVVGLFHGHSVVIRCFDNGLVLPAAGTWMSKVASRWQLVALITVNWANFISRFVLVS